MPLIVSDAYAAAALSDATAPLPIIGWQNLVSVTTLAADAEDPLYPVTNLGNPDTSLVWKSGSTSDGYLTVMFGGSFSVDYAGVVGHNFGSGNIATTIEGTENGTDWFELVEEAVPGSDGVLIFRFLPTTLAGVRLKLEPDAVEPEAAVLYVGKLLVFERGVQPHTPLQLGRKRKIRSSVSEGGKFLGRVVSGGTRSATATFSNLTPGWVRAYLDPFLGALAENPFFWAWSPAAYPLEVGFAWLPGDAVPQTSHLVGYMSLSLPMEGIV